VPWERMARISPARGAVDRKWQAVQFFRSQLEPNNSGEPILPPFVLDRLRAVGEVVFA
jgi:hypothetical protein